jgi:uncharacterized protein (TIGR03435 family)
LRAQSPVAQSRVPQWQIDAGGSADFDAESVRLDRSGGGGRNNLALAGGHLAMKSVSLRQLLAQAYKFASLSDAVNMIVGMPDWANSERFDIDAEADGDPSTDQKRLMLQSLLVRRFELAVHHEKRQLPVYILLVAKPGKLGPQIHPNADTPCSEDLTAENRNAARRLTLARRCRCGSIGAIPMWPRRRWTTGPK